MGEREVILHNSTTIYHLFAMISGQTFHPRHESYRCQDKQSPYHNTFTMFTELREYFANRTLRKQTHFKANGSRMCVYKQYKHLRIINDRLRTTHQ